MTREQLYQQFLHEFPIDTLRELPINRYTNLNKSDSFCYWLETKLETLGMIRGTAFYKYGIYEYKTEPARSSAAYSHDKRYAWKARLGRTAEEAYATVLNGICEIAENARNGHFEKIDNTKVVDSIVRWKIAFLYSNEKLVPIYKTEMLVTLAEHFGMKDAGEAAQADLNTFIIKKKGEKNIFDFYDELLGILKGNHLKDEHPLINSNTPRYWIYSPGMKSSKWERCREDGIACIGWEALGDLSTFNSREAVRKAIQDVYGKQDSSCKNDTLAIWEFSHVMQPGDVIFAKSGQERLLGRGIVTSDYEFDETYEDFNNVRKIDWQKTGIWDTPCKSVHKILTDITPYPDYVKKLEDVFSNGAGRNYWWLVANPRIWSFSSIRPGEEQDYTLFNNNGNPRRILKNFQNAKAGDAIIGYEANPVKKIVAIAEVSKDTDEKLFHFKKTRSLTEPISYSDVKENPELSSMEFLRNPNGSLFRLTRGEYDAVMDMVLEQNPTEVHIKSEKYGKKEFLSDVYITEADYDSLSHLLKAKKNVILQGPPGVGKTFSAKRLAYSIMGEKDDSRISFIQFHQNYSYEDLMLGLKPNAEGGFDLNHGIFYNACKKAQDDSGRDYFFIIDEINRGNLSKIFGELLMLIENSYRDVEIQLPYGGERFSVPKNLYIIGMMNTADRSLALIDYALRRRFSFFGIKPGFVSDGFRKYQVKIGNKTFDNIIDGIKKLNLTIAQDASLGEGFCIGHSYFCSQDSYDEIWMKNVIEYDIKPMLEEYWFDNPQTADAEVAKLEAMLK